MSPYHFCCFPKKTKPFASSLFLNITRVGRESRVAIHEQSHALERNGLVAVIEQLSNKHSMSLIEYCSEKDICKELSVCCKEVFTELSN